MASSTRSSSASSSKNATLNDIHDMILSMKQTMATKDDIKSINESINEMRSSITSIENKAETNSKAIISLEKQLSKTQSELTNLKTRSMRENLIIYNIPEDAGESTPGERNPKKLKDKIVTFVSDNLKLESGEQGFDRFHRMGVFREGRIRPTVLHFSDHAVQASWMANAKNFKGSTYSLSRQYPDEVRARRKQLVPIMINFRREGKVAVLNADKLYVDRVLYTGPVDD